MWEWVDKLGKKKFFQRDEDETPKFLDNDGDIKDAFEDKEEIEEDAEKQ